MAPTNAEVEAAAEVAYTNNRAGTAPWQELDDRWKQDWRAKVTPVLEAAARARPAPAAEVPQSVADRAWEFTQGSFKSFGLPEHRLREYSAIIAELIQGAVDAETERLQGIIENMREIRTTRAVEQKAP